MKYQIGDKVKFLNEVGEGEVVSIIDKSKVYIMTTDGFEVPVLISELVLLSRPGETALSKPTLTENSPGTGPKDHTGAPQEDEGSIILDEEVVFALTLSQSRAEIMSYIVNSSTYHLYFVVSIRREGEDLFFAGGTLEPDTKVQTGRIMPAKIGEEIELSLNLIFYGKSFYRHIKPVELPLKINPGEIYNGHLMVENDYFEEKASLFTLYSFKKPVENESEKVHFSGKLEDLIRLKEEERQPPSVSKRAVRNPGIEEIDLHIEAITENFQSLSNAEIAEMQMARFKTSMDTAIIHKTKRIVFIHGVGAGKLKHEIRRALDRDYRDFTYQDASFREYGFGATMVIVPQKSGK